MSGIVFSCTLKSKDGGQTFYYVQPDSFVSFKEKICLSTKTVRVDRIHNGAIVEAYADIALDSSFSYMKRHENYMQYNGLKPRWIHAYFKSEHIMTNFSIAKDLLLSNVIKSRAFGKTKCAMVIDRKLGGFYVDYNLYPLITNYSPEVISNFKWVEYLYFVMQMWLLGSINNPTINYEVLVEYSNQYGDLPFEIQYSIQFKADKNDNKEVLLQLFQHLSRFSREQPLNAKQFYTCAQDITDMSQDLENLKLLTFERLQLEEILKSNKIFKKGSYRENEQLLLDINVKWEAIFDLVTNIGLKSANSSNNMPLLNTPNFNFNDQMKANNSMQISDTKTKNARRSEARREKKKNSLKNSEGSIAGINEETSTDVPENGQSYSNQSPSHISSRSTSYSKGLEDLSSFVNLGIDQPKTQKNHNNSSDSLWNSNSSQPEPTKSRDPSSDWNNGQDDDHTVNKPSTTREQTEPTSRFSSNPKESLFANCKDPSDWNNGQDGGHTVNKPSTTREQTEQTSRFSSNPKESLFANCKDPSDWGNDDEEDTLPKSGNEAKDNLTSYDSDSNISVVSSKASESKSSSRTFNSSGYQRPRTERFDRRDKSKNIIISGMEYQSDDDLINIVVDFLKQVLRMEVQVKRVVIVGPADKPLLCVQFESEEDKNQVLSNGRKILTMLRSRIRISEDLSYEERMARRNKMAENSN